MCKGSKSCHVARVYQDVGNGMCKQTNVLASKCGKTYEKDCSHNKLISHKAARQAGCPITKNINNFKMDQSKKIGRPQIQGINAGVFNLSLKNNAAVAKEVIIGDGAGTICAGKNIDCSTQFADIDIDGSFGTDSAAKLKSISSVVPLNVQGLHIEQIVGSGFFAGSAIRTAQGSFNNTKLTELPVDTQFATSSNTQDKSIRNLSCFQFTFAPFTGLVIKIPAGATVNFTFNVTEVADVNIYETV